MWVHIRNSADIGGLRTFPRLIGMPIKREYEVKSVVEIHKDYDGEWWVRAHFRGHRQPDPIYYTLDSFRNSLEAIWDYIRANRCRRLPWNRYDLYDEMYNLWGLTREDVPWDIGGLGETILERAERERQDVEEMLRNADPTLGRRRRAY